jgi:YfiR/HmsC-like
MDSAVLRETEPVSVRIKTAWLLGALAFSLMPGKPAALAADSEDQLKSATVWLFVQYSNLEPGVDGAITVGVLGRTAFAQALRHTLEGKSTGGHPVRVVDAKADLRCCQIVYLATGRNEEIRRVVQSTPPLRALTIGESDNFLGIGGAVNLFIADGHITFEASLDALDRSGVTISSNLLKFGQVHGRGKGSAAK